jgi:hypothetical protein
MKKLIALVAVLSFMVPIAAFADSTVTASAGTGASISPSGTVIVPIGVDQVFDVGAQSGYTLSDVSVDGVSQGAVSTYDLIGDLVDHTIVASASIVAPTGGSQPYCSSPSAPGWRVGLIGGGCPGNTSIYIPHGQTLNGFTCPDAFVAGCVIKQ